MGARNRTASLRGATRAARRTPGQSGIDSSGPCADLDRPPARNVRSPGVPIVLALAALTALAAGKRLVEGAHPPPPALDAGSYLLAVLGRRWRRSGCAPCRLSRWAPRRCALAWRPRSAGEGNCRIPFRFPSAHAMGDADRNSLGGGTRRTPRTLDQERSRTRGCRSRDARALDTRRYRESMPAVKRSIFTRRRARSRARRRSWRSRPLAVAIHGADHRGRRSSPIERESRGRAPTFRYEESRRVSPGDSRRRKALAHQDERPARGDGSPSSWSARVPSQRVRWCGLRGRSSSSIRPALFFLGPPRLPACHHASRRPGQSRPAPARGSAAGCRSRPRSLRGAGAVASFFFRGFQRALLAASSESAAAAPAAACECEEVVDLASPRTESSGRR